MKKSYILATFVLIFLAFTSCYGCASSNSAENETTEKLDEEMKSNSQSQNTNLKMSIGGTEVQVAWEENESVTALKNLAMEKNPLEIQMSMYGGFEQVGRIGKSLPRNDSEITTRPGDIVLYLGNQIVLFYGSNSWNYTRLGKIMDKSASEMHGLLSNGDVVIKIWAE